MVVVPGRELRGGGGGRVNEALGEKFAGRGPGVRERGDVGDEAVPT